MWAQRNCQILWTLSLSPAPKMAATAAAAAALMGRVIFVQHVVALVISGAGAGAETEGCVGVLLGQA